MLYPWTPTRSHFPVPGNSHLEQQRSRTLPNPAPLTASFFCFRSWLARCLWSTLLSSFLTFLLRVFSARRPEGHIRRGWCDRPHNKVKKKDSSPPTLERAFRVEPRRETESSVWAWGKRVNNGQIALIPSTLSSYPCRPAVQIPDPDAARLYELYSAA